MTPTDLILSLRPADGSSTAITAAIERARTALAGVDNDISAAQQEHDRELLDAEPSRLQDLTKRFTKTREDLAGTRDRVSAVLAQLEDRLIAARRDEAEEILAAKREKVEAAGRALVKLLESKRAKLAADLRELELADTAYADAQREFATISARTSRGYSSMEVSFPEPTGNAAAKWRDEIEAMMQPIRKPFVPLEPSPEALEREERLRVATGSYVRHAERGTHGATPAWPN